MDDADFVDAHQTAAFHGRSVSGYLPRSKVGQLRRDVELAPFGQWPPSTIRELLGEIDQLAAALRRHHPPHHDVEGCDTCNLIRRVAP